jgi:hypothetical protein
MLSNRHYVKIIIGFVVWACLNFFITGFAQASYYYSGINPKVLALGLKAYQYAQSQGKATKPILVIVDYTIASSKARLWVLDLKRKQILSQLHVSHGVGSSSKTNPALAKTFSNKSGSRASSLGVYVTQNEYKGKHGDSLRLQGLEKGINDAAYRRTIVLHPASYMTSSFIDRYGYAGRSYGCFAVNPQESEQLINTIKDGSVLFAYGPGIDKDPNLA